VEKYYISVGINHSKHWRRNVPICPAVVLTSRDHVGVWRTRRCRVRSICPAAFILWIAVLQGVSVFVMLQLWRGWHVACERHVARRFTERHWRLLCRQAASDVNERRFRQFTRHSDVTHSLSISSNSSSTTWLQRHVQLRHRHAQSTCTCYLRCLL